MIPEAIDRDLARTGPLATCHLALAQSDCRGFQVASGDPCYRWPETPLPVPPRRLISGGPFGRGSCFAWRLDSPCQIRFTWQRRGDEIDFSMMKAYRFFFCVCVTRGNNSPCCLISVMCAAVGHARGCKGRATRRLGDPRHDRPSSPCLFCLDSPHKNGLPVPWGRDTPGRCDRAGGISSDPGK